MTGILPINKPKGMTSHSVTSVMKRLTGEKCGHGGTLDPMATGVLPVLVGRATRLSDFLLEDKEYIAGILLGVKTDTGDITGNIIEKTDLVSVTAENFSKALNSFSGEILQTPPMYSAIKKDGIKMYELARKGLSVDIEPRKVTIYETELLDFDEEKGLFTVRIKCSKGTYIRSLAEDIGKKLNLPATLNSLIRSLSAGINLSDCITVEAAKSMTAGELEGHIISPENYFSYLPKLVLKDNAVRYYLNGGTIAKTRCNCEENERLFRVYSDNNRFLGLCESVILEETDSVKSVWKSIE